ncbi:MAG TPA: metallopeptidase family protein [Candidatus Saccharimonadales bacterium]|nr:metallopeptidase family protein [Candidatus Saccharimonadales bacterium]
MITVTDDEFSALIADALERLPRQHRSAIKNVAIVYEDEPSPEQRERLKLACNQTLFGLYEGVPLPQRMGVTGYGPDKITIFKRPLTASVDSLPALRKEIYHTLWHEVAHYFGLNHTRIHELEQ